MPNSILDLILVAIKSSGKTIAQISEKSGVNRNTISSWFYGKSSPTVFNAEAVLNTIGYTLILEKRENFDGRNS